MSGATYRIEVAKNSPEADDPYGALIVRLSDEKAIHYVSGASAHWAEQVAREWVAIYSAEINEDYTLHVDDAGEDAPLYSVKV